MSMSVYGMRAWYTEQANGYWPISSRPVVRRHAPPVTRSLTARPAGKGGGR